MNRDDAPPAIPKVMPNWIDWAPGSVGTDHALWRAQKKYDRCIREGRPVGPLRDEPPYWWQRRKRRQL